jgi:hypothetical protein
MGYYFLKIAKNPGNLDYMVSLLKESSTKKYFALFFLYSELSLLTKHLTIPPKLVSGKNHQKFCKKRVLCILQSTLRSIL